MTDCTGKRAGDKISSLTTLLKNYRPSRVLWLGPYSPIAIQGADVFVQISDGDWQAGALHATDALFFTSSVHALPFANEAFDLIVCMHAQQTEPHLTHWFTELERVLVAEGLCVIYGEDYLQVKTAQVRRGALPQRFVSWQQLVLLARRFSLNKVYKKRLVHWEQSASCSWSRCCVAWLHWCIPWCNLEYELVLVKREPAWLSASQMQVAYNT